MRLYGPGTANLYPIFRLCKKQETHAKRLYHINLTADKPANRPPYPFPTGISSSGTRD